MFPVENPSRLKPTQPSPRFNAGRPTAVYGLALGFDGDRHRHASITFSKLFNNGTKYLLEEQEIIMKERQQIPVCNRKHGTTLLNYDGMILIINV